MKNVTAFLGQIDPEEHVLGFASVDDQENGVANARQEFCGHYLDLSMMALRFKKQGIYAIL